MSQIPNFYFIIVRRDSFRKFLVWVCLGNKEILCPVQQGLDLKTLHVCLSLIRFMKPISLWGSNRIGRDITESEKTRGNNHYTFFSSLGHQQAMKEGQCWGSELGSAGLSFIPIPLYFLYGYYKLSLFSIGYLGLYYCPHSHMSLCVVLKCMYFMCVLLLWENQFQHSKMIKLVLRKLTLIIANR